MENTSPIKVNKYLRIRLCIYIHVFLRIKKVSTRCDLHYRKWYYHYQKKNDGRSDVFELVLNIEVCFWLKIIKSYVSNPEYQRYLHKINHYSSLGHFRHVTKCALSTFERRLGHLVTRLAD